MTGTLCFRRTWLEVVGVERMRSRRYQIDCYQIRIPRVSGESFWRSPQGSGQHSLAGTNEVLWPGNNAGRPMHVLQRQWTSEI